jgi:sulfofructose kinase
VTPTFDVAGVGTNSADEVLNIPLLVRELAATPKARIRQRQVICGGQTATTVTACAALGLRTRYVGAFGSDADGHVVRETLRQRGVDLDCSIICDAPNRSAVILVDPEGQRTVLWHRDNQLQMRPEDVRPPSLDARVIHVDDDDQDLALSVAASACARGSVVTSDIEHLSDKTEQLIGSVTYPILEQGLSEKLTGESDPERALRKLRRLSPHVLLITRAERGVVALEGDRFHNVPAFEVKAIDNTGAGDIFRAGFIYGLLMRWELPEILRFANAAAAISCTRLGAIPSVPTLGEVHALLKQ